MPILFYLFFLVAEFSLQSVKSRVVVALSHKDTNKAALVSKIAFGPR